MPENSQGLHEPLETLRAETIDMHRAVVSVMEELQAIDWYGQRVDAAQDPELRAILQHNRDDEKEHAAMLLEWIRRHDAVFEQQLRKFLFRDGPIATQDPRAGNGSSSASRTSIGSLREVKT
jgi:ferritin-like protein